MKKPPLQDVIVMRGVQRTGVHDVRNHLTHEVERHSSAIPPRRPMPITRERDRDSREFRDHRPEERYSPVSDERKTPWIAIALMSGAALAGGAFALSLFFSGATVTAYPKRDTVIADTVFTASTNGMPADMTASIVTIERTAVREVAAQSETQVDERASGLITVYNEYSKTPQRLIKNTRFEAEDGKIYKIRESIEVPGQQADGTPGALEVTVYAEEPGDSYNRGPGSFSIPGFEKRPQEGKVYARSSGNMTGGFVGVKRVVLEKDRLTGYEALETQLRDELRSALLEPGSVSESSWVDPDAVFYEFNQLPDEIAEGENVRLSLSGKVHAVAFDRSALDKFIAMRVVPGFVDSPLEITNRSELSIVVEPQVLGTSSPALTPWQNGLYTVSLTGRAELLWQVDAAALVQSLLGIDKSLVENGMSEELRAEHPGVDRLHVVSRPFWKSSLPESVDAIELTVTLDE